MSEFARAFPAWMVDGEPRSWRHYVYGMMHLARAGARESLRLSTAAQMAFAKKEDAETWMRTQRAVAGW